MTVSAQKLVGEQPQKMSRSEAGRKGYEVRARRNTIRLFILAHYGHMVLEIQLRNAMQSPVANRENFEGEGPVTIVTSDMILPPPLPIQVTWDMIFPNVPSVAEALPPPLPLTVEPWMIIPPPLPIPERRTMTFARRRSMRS